MIGAKEKFHVISLEEKRDIALNGLFLGLRKTGEFDVHIYCKDNYFFELFYSRTLEKLIAITAFKRHDEINTRFELN